MSEQEFITVKEAAARLGVSVRTLQIWIAEGQFHGAYKLNPAKSNSPYRIPAADIASFEARRNTLATISN